MISCAANRRDTLRRLGTGLAAFGLSLVMGAATANRPAIALLVSGCALTLALLIIASDHQRGFFVVAAVSLAFVPIYASPSLHNLALEPTAVLLWLLGGAIFLRFTQETLALRLSAVDVAALLFFALLALSVLAGARSFNDLFITEFLWLGPYLGARLLVAKAGAHFFVRTVAIVGLALAPFVFFEAATRRNVFSGLVLQKTVAAIWLEPLSRFGKVRVAASFGQPLALSAFLATVCVFCVALSLDPRERRRATWWIVGACVLAVAMALTFSRTGWVVLAVAIGLLAIRKVGLLSSARFAIALGLLILTILFLPQAKPAREIAASMVSSPPTSDLATNRDYRVQLASEALRPGIVKPFGNRQNAIEGSVDNEYVYLADQWGFVPLAGFLLLAFFVVRAAVVERSDPVKLAVIAVTAANLVGLAFVALITQQQILIWMLLGATAAISARSVEEEK